MLQSTVLEIGSTIMTGTLRHAAASGVIGIPCAMASSVPPWPLAIGWFRLLLLLLFVEVPVLHLLFLMLALLVVVVLGGGSGGMWWRRCRCFYVRCGCYGCCCCVVVVNRVAVTSSDIDAVLFNTFARSRNS
jgi:hypothetical protein